ncbi:MAG: hypothetical protein NZR01_04550, partial [Bryobacteraceae bacterium]|nr:hypothetical protein [Bryobacteraceae bacterium]
VFDGKTRTRTRRGLARDGWKPPMGRLEKSSPCAEQALVHGDAELKIEGNHTCTTLKNTKLLTLQHYHCTVLGDRKLVENGNLTHTTIGKATHTVIGPAAVNHVGPVTASYIAPLTETHCSPRNINQPTSFLESVQSALKNFGVETEISSASVQLTLSDLYLKASAFGFTGIGYENTLLNLKKEDAKIVINSLCYTQIVSTRVNISALFLSSGMTASSLKMASNSYAM